MPLIIRHPETPEYQPRCLVTDPALQIVRRAFRRQMAVHRHTHHGQPSSLRGGPSRRPPQLSATCTTREGVAQLRATGVLHTAATGTRRRPSCRCKLLLDALGFTSLLCLGVYLCAFPVSQRYREPTGSAVCAGAMWSARKHIFFTTFVLVAVALVGYPPPPHTAHCGYLVESTPAHGDARHSLRAS